MYTFFFPRRFGIDFHVVGYSALIRSGQLSRKEGWDMLKELPDNDPEIVDMVKARLKLSDHKFYELMSAPVKSYKDYKTYKPTFEKVRPFFYSYGKKRVNSLEFLH